MESSTLRTVLIGTVALSLALGLTAGPVAAQEVPEPPELPGAPGGDAPSEVEVNVTATTDGIDLNVSGGGGGLDCELQPPEGTGAPGNPCDAEPPGDGGGLPGPELPSPPEGLPAP